ncbi:MAG: hypothetical protein DRR08_05255 [Candidatus Parabeggiatoa sp. nov. 2]|nr:MAG: hypothetical protein DRR08_05255 [Gammaproteobacteria bacterium]
MGHGIFLQSFYQCGFHLAVISYRAWVFKLPRLKEIRFLQEIGFLADNSITWKLHYRAIL